MTAQFSREAARVLASSYFTDYPDGMTPDEIIAWSVGRRKERAALEDGLKAAETRDDLTGEAKRVYDAAYQAVEESLDMRDYYERIHS